MGAINMSSSTRAGHSFIMTRLLNCFFIFLWSASPSLCCPSGWTALGGSCYMVASRMSTWYAAQTFCREQGGYLAEITNMSEFSLLEQYLLNYESNYWIGLTDDAKEGAWIWSESDVQATWTNWGPGDPNSYYGDEDCVNLLSKLAHTFNDSPCDRIEIYPSHGLCEFNY